MAKSKKIILFLFLVIAIVFQSLPVIRSGLLYSYGYGFWGPTGHDGIWHLALINHITNPFIINHPTIAGLRLTNYHPLFDIIVAVIANITHINSSLILFQFTPILLSSLIIILSYYLGLLLTNKSRGGVYLVFLNTFATSFGWVYTLLTAGKFGGESLFWSMQSASTQLNPPYALSLIVLLLFLILLKQQKKWVLIILLCCLAPITKSYAGVVIFLLFGFYVLHQPKHFYKLGISFIIALAIFYWYNQQPSQLFIFQPLWFVHTMLNSTDRVFIPKVASFINTALSTNHFNLKLIIIDILGLCLFILGNFSWRLLGILKPLKELSLLPTIIIITIIPLLFIQKGTAWNTIQFLYYSLFIANIFLAYYLTYNASKIIILVIIITSVIGNLDTYQGDIGNPSPSSLPPAEINALNYLSSLPGKIVVTYPYDEYSKRHFTSTPIPLFAYDTTGYVSAYSKKYTYLEDEMNLSISGYDVTSRRNQEISFFKQQNIFQDRGFLVNNHIDYIYIANQDLQPFNPDLTKLSLKLLYNQDKTAIYQVNR